MYLIGDRLIVTGMELAGLKNSVVADKDNIGNVLKDVSNRARIIVITNSLARHAEKDIEKLRKFEKIIVEIPDRTGSGEDTIGKLVREVIGFELKK